MMDALSIKFTTTNAAFGDDPNDEIARILRGLARRFEDGEVMGHGDSFRVMDINGNTIGLVKAT